MAKNRMTRREFIRHSMAVATGACCAQAFGTLGNNVVFAQSPAGNGRTAVVITLDGGTDYLAAFDIPFSSSAYFDIRPTIAIPQNRILVTESGRGVHPALVNLQRLFLDGDVAIIPEIGPTNPSRSHDEEQAKYSNGQLSGAGWMGRTFDKNPLDNVTIFNTVAMGLGTPLDTIAQRAEKRPINMSSLANFTLRNDETGTADNVFRQDIHKAILAATVTSTPIVRSARLSQQGLYDTVATVNQARLAYNARVGRPNYGNNSPGTALQQIAALIYSNLGTQLALCGMGGYDLHSDLGSVDANGNVIGNQATLLGRLDTAIGAFEMDMKQMAKWNDVCLIIQTEFGRTLKENGSKGSDHGKGACQIVIGGGVNGGYRRPVLTNAQLTARNDWVEVRVHFQNVFKETLSFLGLSSNGVFGPHTTTALNLYS